MKIYDISTPKENTEVENLNEKETSNFEISEDGESYLFELLRKNLYTDNIKAIIKELSANCIDSHIEANVNLPFEIEIIENEDSLIIEGEYIVFRDFGTGLSPEMIDNIYSKYFASTKRTTNKSIGGFGLGSKTPFAYTDTFIINTKPINSISEYQYVAFIDESTKGKITLVSKFTSNLDINKGYTEIKIPLIAKKDKQIFSNKIAEVLNFINKDSFKLINIKEYSRRSDYYGKNEIPKIIKETENYFIVSGNWDIVTIKGFVYNVNFSYETNKIGINYNNNDFSYVPKFKVGELENSRNREYIENNEKNIKVLNTFLLKLNKVINAGVEGLLSNFCSNEDKYIALYILSRYNNKYGVNYIYNYRITNDYANYYTKTYLTNSNTFFVDITYKIINLAVHSIKNNKKTKEYESLIYNLYNNVKNFNFVTYNFLNSNSNISKNLLYSEIANKSLSSTCYIIDKIQIKVLEIFDKLFKLNYHNIDNEFTNIKIKKEKHIKSTNDVFVRRLIQHNITVNYDAKNIIENSKYVNYDSNLENYSSNQIIIYGKAEDDKQLKLCNAIVGSILNRYEYNVFKVSNTIHKKMSKNENFISCNKLFSFDNIITQNITSALYYINTFKVNEIICNYVTNQLRDINSNFGNELSLLINFKNKMESFIILYKNNHEIKTLIDSYLDTWYSLKIENTPINNTIFYIKNFISGLEHLVCSNITNIQIKENMLNILKLMNKNNL